MRTHASFAKMFQLNPDKAGDAGAGDKKARHAFLPGTGSAQPWGQVGHRVEAGPRPSFASASALQYAPLPTGLRGRQVYRVGENCTCSFADLSLRIAAIEAKANAAAAVNPAMTPPFG